MDKYKEGLVELFKKKFTEREEDEVYYMLKIKCPTWFHDKYVKITKYGENFFKNLRKSKNGVFRSFGLSKLIEDTPALSEEDKKEMTRRIDFTLYIKTKLRNIFETNDKYEETLISNFIDKYIEYKIQIFKDKLGENYEFYSLFAKDKLSILLQFIKPQA